MGRSVGLFEGVRFEAKCPSSLFWWSSSWAWACLFPDTSFLWPSEMWRTLRREHPTWSSPRWILGPGHQRVLGRLLGQWQGRDLTTWKLIFEGKLWKERWGRKGFSLVHFHIEPRCWAIVKLMFGCFHLSCWNCVPGLNWTYFWSAWKWREEASGSVFEKLWRVWLRNERNQK